MASCTSSTWQWPMGRNTCTWVTSWRHPDSHQQTSVHLLMHAPRYSVKGGNIQPKWRYSLVDQTSMTVSPYIWGGPSSFGGEKKETKISLLHWFQQCSSFWDHSYKSLYFPCLHRGLLPDGRLCIRIMQGRAYIFIVITSTMTPAFGICLTDQESFAKCMVIWVLAHFQNQAVSVNDLVS